MVEAFKFMWRVEGMKGFFKGNGVNVVKIAPFSAFEFYFYEVYKKYLFNNPNTFTAKMVCGGLTGMTASFLTYPLDLIKTVLTINVNEDPKNVGIWKCGKDIYLKDGVFGLYRGLFISLAGITPFIAIKMCSFDMLKVSYLPNRDHPRFNTINLVLGAVAGTIAVTFTYPIDLIRKYLQLSGMQGHEKYDGFVDCC